MPGTKKGRSELRPFLHFRMGGRVALMLPGHYGFKSPYRPCRRIPPPPGMPPASFFGRSATMASVVISRAATERRVLQRDAHDLGRVDDAGVDEVDIFLVLRVVAVGVRLLLQQLADDDRGFLARILDDLTRIGAWIALRTIAMPWVWSSLSPVKAVERLGGIEQSACRRRERCLPRPPPSWR